MKQLYFMLCAVLMLLAGMPVSAQKSYGISGKVTDQAGNGIVGASVVVKGTTTGTSTGSDGSYSLNIKDRNATLVCSFIGMKSAETGINGRTEVNFTLEADAIGLEEVVAIGYGTIRKEEITSSITRVSSDEFLQGSVSNPLQLLQGKVAGLGISKTSGNPSGELSIAARYLYVGCFFGTAHRDRRCGRRIPQCHFTGRHRIHRCSEGWFGCGYLRYTRNERCDYHQHQATAVGTCHVGI